ncbi:MAG: hypothetical protein PCFJNLEI_00675 [Verrucomicrobiae bacterium]|nr:hypothetical protein [Verrucomicrobiae bacterium]
MPENTPLQQLQELLRELFQFEFGDLDFGIYKLLHLKRGEVEKFLTVQLPETVKREFKKLAGDELTALEHEIQELAKRIREVDDEAILQNGDLNPQRQKRGLLKTYAEKRQQLHQSQATDEQQADVFNHLHNFFARYYDEGDFIPRPRRGSNHTRYAVPYNGEETYFHWANRDQHYIKTAENFRDYSFAVTGTLRGDYRIRFTLTEADVPKENTKGDMRWFFPQPAEAKSDEAAKVFTLPFHYRLPTEKEVTRHGTGTKGQDAVLRQNVPDIVAKVSDAILQSELAKIVEVKNSDEPKRREEISCLLKRLRHFTKRNTTDYFIHKKLREFLTVELEFYIKDQIIQLPDLTSDFEPKRRMLRVFKALAEQVIEFLCQVEDVQKRLFEKRKFVLRTDYLVPIKHVPTELWPAIVANEKQVAAWKELFGIKPRQDLLNRKGEVNEQFLSEHPTLVVNTEHFQDILGFKEKLIEAFENLDEATDGLLIQAENYQVLRFLERKYAGKVRCTYIDPPYNRGEDRFIYKDRYRHSSWVAMMTERVSAGAKLLSNEGVFFASIDDNEQHRFRLLLNEVLNEENFISVIVVQSNKRGQTYKEIATTHEYMLVYARNPDTELFEFEKEDEALPYEDAVGKFDLWELRNRNPKFGRFNREDLFYPIFVAPDIKDESGFARISLTKTKEFCVTVHPRNSEGEDGCWRWGKGPGEKMAVIDLTCPLPEVVAKQRQDGEWNIYQKSRKSTTKAKSLWTETEVISEQGTVTLGELGLASKFQHPKPVELIRRSIQISTEPGDIVLDYFGGSGTTGHAAIALGRDSGGHRRFILAEMASYFDSVILPRIQKVMFTPEWKDGKPVRMATKEETERTPRLVKVLRLEGYEDALHNLVTEETTKREAARSKAHKKLDEEKYRLSYMLRLPLEASASMLNLAELEHPFSYQIEALTETGPKTETVDLVETFNFLYGLHVERIESWRDTAGKRDYRVVKARSGDGHKRVLVVWRDMAGLDPKVERTFLESKLREEKTSYDEKWINGDTVAIHGTQFQSLDGLFKQLMEEPERES